LRAPCDARGIARVHGSTARGIIAAETDGDDADLFGIDIAALLEKIDARAARDFIVVAQVMTAEANRLSSARAIHDQHGYTALDEIGTPRMYWISFVTSKPSKNTTQGALSAFVFCACTK
jgi:hypothetical protein